MITSQQSDMTQRTDRTIATSMRRHNALRTAASCRRFEPRVELEACVRGFVARRVEGAADSEHLSRFPATASCSLSWFLEGSAVRVCDEQSTQACIVFRGPQTRPVVVRHRGPLHMFILLLAADALWWLTGVRVDRHLNRICPVAAALDDSWQAMALDVLHATTDEDRVKQIEKFLTVKSSLGHCLLAMPANPWREENSTNMAVDQFFESTFVSVHRSTRETFQRDPD